MYINSFSEDTIHIDYESLNGNKNEVELTAVVTFNGGDKAFDFPFVFEENKRKKIFGLKRKSEIMETLKKMSFEDVISSIEYIKRNSDSFYHSAGSFSDYDYIADKKIKLKEGDYNGLQGQRLYY